MARDKLIASAMKVTKLASNILQCSNLRNTKKGISEYHHLRDRIAFKMRSLCEERCAIWRVGANRSMNLELDRSVCEELFPG